MKKKITIILVIFVLMFTTLLSGCDFFKSLFLTDEQKAEDQKALEQEAILKEEIKNDTPDINPDDIVIPNNATEEEINALKEEKEYWTIIKTIKGFDSAIQQTYKTRSEYLPSYDIEQSGFQSIRKIHYFLISDSNDSIDRVYVYTDFLYNDTLNSGKTVLKQASGFIAFGHRTKEITHDCTYNELLNYINDNDTEVSIDDMLLNDMPNLLDCYNYHLKEEVDNLFKYATNEPIELLAIGHSPIGVGNAPNYINTVQKVIQKNNSVIYTMLSFHLSYDYTYEEWINISTNKSDLFCTINKYTRYSPLCISDNIQQKYFIYNQIK